ncbi:MAG TPA: hypothetical protein PK760_04585 [Flavobacteriales bacterium]|nr:hypothetical protein [Flavobacteriales bacterium]
MLLLACLLPLLASAENDPRLSRIIARGHVGRIDRYMRRLIHREGRDHRAPTYMFPLGGAEDVISDLYGLLRTQIGVNAVDWDRCVIQVGTWPGTWTLGVVFRTREGKVDDILERCYTIQGGRPGTINLFGWHPRVRKDRYHLKVKRVTTCPDFLEQQRKICDDREY